MRSSRNLVRVVCGKSTAAIFRLVSAPAIICSPLEPHLLFSVRQIGHTYATASDMFRLPLKSAHSWCTHLLQPPGEMRRGNCHHYHYHCLKCASWDISQERMQYVSESEGRAVCCAYHHTAPRVLPSLRSASSCSSRDQP
jgi:hypothetical protein